jgi:hypothetical protein
MGVMSLGDLVADRRSNSVRIGTAGRTSKARGSTACTPPYRWDPRGVVMVGWGVTVGDGRHVAGWW